MKKDKSRRKSPSKSKSVDNSINNNISNNNTTNDRSRLNSLGGMSSVSFDPQSIRYDETRSRSGSNSTIQRRLSTSTDGATTASRKSSISFDYNPNSNELLMPPPNYPTYNSAQQSYPFQSSLPNYESNLLDTSLYRSQNGQQSLLQLQQPLLAVQTQTQQPKITKRKPVVSSPRSMTHKNSQPIVPVLHSNNINNTRNRSTSLDGKPPRPPTQIQTINRNISNNYVKTVNSSNNNNNNNIDTLERAKSRQIRSSRSVSPGLRQSNRINNGIINNGSTIKLSTFGSAETRRL